MNRKNMNDWPIGLINPQGDRAGEVLFNKNYFYQLPEEPDIDEEKVNIIIVEGVEDRGLGLAIMNRLRNASYKTIKV